MVMFSKVNVFIYCSKVVKVFKEFLNKDKVIKYWYKDFIRFLSE